MTDEKTGIRIVWEKVPDWIEWVSFEFNHGGRAMGWSTEPTLTNDAFGLWTNYYCQDDDGFFCEIPYYYAECSPDVLMEKRIARRPVNPPNAQESPGAKRSGEFPC